MLRLVLPRIWVILLTVLLLAAPAGVIAEASDATAEHCDDLAALGDASLVETAPKRAICIIPVDDVPPPPAPARVFRPPRSNAS